jgi:hypothetical protein
VLTIVGLKALAIVVVVKVTLPEFVVVKMAI